MNAFIARVPLLFISFHHAGCSGIRCQRMISLTPAKIAINVYHSVMERDLDVICVCHRQNFAHAAAVTNRYCGRECQKSNWRVHKPECAEIAELWKSANRMVQQ
ncbi:hypothetical protein CPB83DRAFT_859734 [Crepidotus variabilis]|uniref:MYND-type domain-containing protein n=1 Tax=Crepidotus variabilis TaxID=179855 RepID=A0A9P6JM04_9AGAR|nr:hypothetical protein CPB83DRAFT_859734 [Crepidotus variabilis]